MESQLLLRAATKLQELRDGRLTRPEEITAAVRYNRKLWMIFGQSVTRDENPLPKAVRTNIFNLAAFVIERSHQIEMKFEPEKIDALININREIAAGLRASDTPAPQPAAG